MTVTHHCGDGSSGDLMPQLSHSRLLFAQKHYSATRAAGIRAALALGHTIRIAAFGIVALLRPRQRQRVRAERAALRVVLGLSGPPLGPYAKTASPELAPS